MVIKKQFGVVIVNGFFDFFVKYISTCLDIIYIILFIIEFQFFYLFFKP